LSDFLLGVSWYSFYLALQVAKSAGGSATAATAINYASVVLILFLFSIFGEAKPVARQSGWWSATIRMTFGNRDEVIMFALIVAGKR
jgi:hypothetical protein